MTSIDLDELADRLDAAADRVGPAIQRRMQHVGALGVGKIKANATRRPGPNVITGAYRASWQDVYRPLVDGAHCTLGTAKPQGRRLEFGFMDRYDSLGRYYRQPPFPHVGPAIPAIEALLREQMGMAVEDALS